jgi:hypothetical protein
VVEEETSQQGVVEGDQRQFVAVGAGPLKSAAFRWEDRGCVVGRANFAAIPGGGLDCTSSLREEGTVVLRLETVASCSSGLLRMNVVEDLFAGMVMVACVVAGIACMELVAWELE